jgi:integrase/recombinase XerD
MNLADIARLRKSDIKDDEICFIREKTKSSNDEETELRIPLTSNIQKIIAGNRNKSIVRDPFIFDILDNKWSEARKYAEIKQLTKQVNKYIRQIAVAVGIKEDITSYSARHSFATIAKNSGTSTEFIKEALGHSSVNVTEKYLKSFEKSTRREHAEKMENLIKTGN